MLSSAKLPFECLLNLFVNYSFKNYRNCTEHCEWSVVCNFHFATIFVRTHVYVFPDFGKLKSVNNAAKHIQDTIYNVRR